MGNSTSRVVGCFVPSANVKDGIDLDFLEPLDEGLGHSFCYVRPGIVDSPAITPSNSERFTVDSSTFDSETHSGSFRQEIVEDLLALQRPNKNFSETTFKTISGASVSANASTARTGNPNMLFSGDAQEPAASFESTASFAAIPLQPLPRGPGPLNGFMSGPLERGFASGPLERGAGCMSGPLEKGAFMSGPLDSTDRSNFSAPLAYGRRRTGFGRLMRSMSRPMKSALSRTFTRPSGASWMQRFFLQPVTQFVWHSKEARFQTEAQRNCVDVGPSENEYNNTRNLQWAHGKAGEDRVHVVLSEEQGWLFVGIYDGFSGPDAPDFLMSNLYRAIDKELEGLLWDYDEKRGKNLNSRDFLKDDIGTCEDCTKEEGLTPLPSIDGLDDRDERQQRSKIEEGVGNESLKADDILEVKGDDIDISIGTSSCSQVCFADPNAEKAGTVGPADLPEYKACSIPESRFSLQGRKSKRLYELLQMELMDEYDAKASLSISEVGRSRTTSWGTQPTVGEDFRARDSLSASQPSENETSTKGEGSSRFEEDFNLRENDGITGEEYKEPKNRDNAPFAAIGNKQMMKRSLMGSKLRKMYKKQKSLRKKLFPWNYDWHREQAHVEEKIVDSSLIIRRCKLGLVDHEAVLRAMSRALEVTEEAYMEMVERALDKNPELALMGSCVLVMLMKDQDVYVMNLGDSRVILAQERVNDRHISPSLTRSRESLVRVELDRISEESPMHNPHIRVCKDNKNREISIYGLRTRAVQLSTDHSTSIQEEVARIKAEHVDDDHAVFNDRVKGQLKVTRAFGAGFLKKPNFNDALLEMFRVPYIGTFPYVSCIPSVCHHRLCSNDRFLVLSSDGLYQYFSNEEVVSHVAWFMENAPEGDPAQYLIAELLFRAAKKNGMDFRELLDIPHGDRRKYHDDVSVMVISLEGRIWRSSG